MNEEEKDSKSDDHPITIISSEDQEITEKKPPNDKIIYFKRVEHKEETDS